MPGARQLSISSHHPAGPAVVFADRIGAYRLRPPFSLQTLRAMLTIAGGDEVNKADLIKDDPENEEFLCEGGD